MFCVGRPSAETALARAWQRQQLEKNKISIAKHEAEAVATAPARRAAQKKNDEQAARYVAAEQKKKDDDFESFKAQVREGLKTCTAHQFSAYSVHAEIRYKTNRRYERWLRSMGMISWEDSKPWFWKPTATFALCPVSVQPSVGYPAVLLEKLGQYQEWKISTAC